MHCSTLLIDLDETVYPTSTGVWDAIAGRMNEYLCTRYGISPDEVIAVRETLYRTYGTTLRGLQEERGVDMEAYLAFVHDIPLHTLLAPDPGLREVLLRYPQRKVIFTNADRPHAERVLRQLRLEDCFDHIIDIYDVAPYCKPMPEAYRIALQVAGETNPSRCIFLDDSPRNLEGARKVGIPTILVGRSDGANGGKDAPALQPFDAAIEHLRNLPEVLSSDGRFLKQAGQIGEAG
jgi:pyrimidine 5'-nucleotidase